MLTKIGGVWVNLYEIAAAEHIPATKLDPEAVDIILQGSEHVLATCSEEEFDAALTAAGLLPDPEADALAIPCEELTELQALYTEGFRYLARDIDGKLYAYRHEPRRDGAYWDPVYQTDDELKPLGKEHYAFVGADDDQPFALATICC